MTIDPTTGEITKTELPPTYTDLITPRVETFSTWYHRLDVIPLHHADPIFSEALSKGMDSVEVYELWQRFIAELLPTTATSNHWRKEFREYVRHAIREALQPRHPQVFPKSLHVTTGL